MPRVGCLALLGRVGALSARGLVWNLAAGFAGACRVGVAFPHTDGKGFNLTLSALPVDGKLVLREPKPEEE